MFIYRFRALKYNITIRNVCQGRNQRRCIYFCINYILPIDISSFILNSERLDIFIISDENAKVSTRSVPFLSQFFLKKVSEKSHGENTVLIRYAPTKITAQFVMHLSVMIEFSRKMWYNDCIQEVREVRL